MPDLPMSTPLSGTEPSLHELGVQPATSAESIQNSQESLQLSLNNVPVFLGERDLRKLCLKLGVDCKIKKAPKWDFAILTFESAEAKETAKALNGHLVKKCQFSVGPVRKVTDC